MVSSNSDVASKPKRAIAVGQGSRDSALVLVTNDEAVGSLEDVELRGAVASVI